MDESSTLEALAGRMTDRIPDEFTVPPNPIPEGCDALTPEMLPLVRLTQAQIERIVQSVPGGAGNIQDIYPLTALQEGMFLHRLISDDADVYARTLLLSLRSQQRLDEFVAALQRAIDRHDVLRTAILWEALPRPLQVVQRRASLRVERLSLDPASHPEEQLRHCMRARQPIDLRSAPLLRLQVAASPSGPQCYLFLHTHHLVFDNASMRALLAELLALIDGRDAELPEPIPYRDHVARSLASAEGSEAEAFFRGKLAEVEAPTAPFDLINVHGDGTRVRTAREPLDAVLTRRMNAQARRLGVTAATLFHCAWGLVVSRTSGRDDVVFGTVLLGRMQRLAAAQPTLGMFINTLPLRLKMRGATAGGLVEQAQRELVELLQHEQASLLLARRCSGIGGSAPLLTTLLNYMPGSEDLFGELPETAGVRLLASRGVTNFPIVLSIYDHGERVLLEVEADGRIDPRRLLEFVFAATQSLVEALERAPQTPILSLATLPQPESRRILERFNATEAPFAREKLVHELFQEQARRTPDEVAVLCGGRSLAYAELNRRANRLARYLRRKGVGADRPVVVCLERGVDMVVGLLGVLKAGGAYVPLDPSHPRARLEYMLEDASPGVLLTQASLRNLLSAAGREVVAIDSDWAAIAKDEADDLNAGELGLTSRNLAYVIYTSGSTGQPKGVMVEHVGVVNFLAAMQCAPGIAPGDCLLSVTTISFDIAALEIFLPLVSGAKLALAERDAAVDPDRLGVLLEQYGVTMMQGTPATWRLLLSAGWPGRRQLRALCGGEALSRELAGQLLQRVGELWNLYGPTETTIWSCARRVAPVSDEDGPVESIGSPIANTRVYILDDHGRPTPIAVAGEIYIGGEGVARGYLNRPELTAERFVRDPFVQDSQARMYKTGDLGRWREDGAIEYLGRNDHQVKIRGYRIELQEIEAQIVGCGEVKEAAVVVREGPHGEKRLVAYVVGKRDTGRLREMLRGRLPEYMVPAVWVTLDRLPRTPNGKLDRRALPAAPGPGQYGGEGAAAAFSAPRTPAEDLLTAIWAEALGTERVGVDADFFDLGGDSLSAVRVFAQIRKVFGRNLPLGTLFAAPTIERLARALQQHASDGPWTSLRAITPEGSKTPLFLVPGIGGNVVSYYDLARRLGAEQPVYGLESRGLDGVQKPLTRIRDIAARFVSDIRAVQPRGPYLLGGACIGGGVAFEMAQQLIAAGDEVSLLAMFDTWPPSVYRAAVIPQYAPPFLNVPVSLAKGVGRLPKTLLHLPVRRWLDHLGNRLDSARKIIASRNVYQADTAALYTDLISRSNYWAMFKYFPKPYAGEIVLFLAAERPPLSSQDAATLWRKFALGGCRVQSVGCTDSGVMLSKPYVEQLASSLQREIERATAERTGQQRVGATA